MNTLENRSVSRLLVLILVAASTLAGCAAGNGMNTASAYDKACKGAAMNDAAAREAFWCWKKAGVNSYEEFVALRNVENKETDGKRIEVAASKAGGAQ
jgi:hypothetical protein